MSENQIRIVVDVGLDLRNALERHASLMGRSVSWVVREAIYEYLQRRGVDVPYRNPDRTYAVLSRKRG